MPSAERLALNEKLFRAVNERIAALNSSTDAPEEPGFVCECALMDCTATLRLSIAEYARIRAQPRRYVVLDGHEADSDIERTVDAHDGYLVIEKLAGQ